MRKINIIFLTMLLINANASTGRGSRGGRGHSEGHGHLERHSGSRRERSESHGSGKSSSSNLTVAPAIVTPPAQAITPTVMTSQLTPQQDGTVHGFITFFNTATPYKYASINGRDKELNDMMTVVDQLIRAIKSPINYDMFNGKNQWDAFCADYLNNAANPTNKELDLNIFNFANIQKDMMSASPQDIDDIYTIITNISKLISKIAIGRSKHHSGKAYWRAVVNRKQSTLSLLSNFKAAFLEAHSVIK